ncbi:HAD hydrolase-like protein [Sphingobacterium chuzhouense]|uniref:HAD hydrolase-like protein n=1 Tax=Sphingobacterium chuzhouense TaxID=1742264 RepID=A0ABR7XMA4_9SPHI|nr:HAD hydrolase-like protein [Sphingobacterium chuzhouense]MBD1420305.1 HAD hydrolase-like protein [Sphingobacterium chuzhouense]
MMNNKAFSFDKSVYVFEIDDVLYPKRDYLLQVYYLFSNFVEYTEGRPLATEIVRFMKQTLEIAGESTVLQKTIAHFELSEKYHENFERLKANAHLPLKLILKDDIKTLLLSLFEKGKKVGILTNGNPVEQLNKLKHIDWQELSEFLPSLKVFFIRELAFRSIEPIDYLVGEYNVSADEIHVITGNESGF